MHRVLNGLHIGSIRGSHRHAQLWPRGSLLWPPLHVVFVLVLVIVTIMFACLSTFIDTFHADTMYDSFRCPPRGMTARPLHIPTEARTPQQFPHRPRRPVRARVSLMALRATDVELRFGSCSVHTQNLWHECVQGLSLPFFRGLISASCLGGISSTS